jgi:hypothetical protein
MISQGEAPRPASAEHGADWYYLRLTRRMRVQGRKYKAGQLLRVHDTRLRVAAWLTRTGAARPADARTRLDVDVFLELQRALPRP